MIERKVEECESGRRLDALVRELAGLSQKQARRLCAIGAVSIDGVRRDGTSRTRTGQRVQFDEQLAQWSLRLGVPVVFADDHVMVLNKPPGLAVHGGPLVDYSLADALQDTLPKSGLVHRLDREASGLLLIGVTTEALQALGAAMESGRVRRSYEAVAVGELPDEATTVDLPLQVTDEPRGDRPKTVVAETGQRSVSHVTVLARRAGFSHVRVELETGRTHQIRAHMRAIGHPLLGDARYGAPAVNARARETFGIRRTLLHSAELRFQTPADGSEVTLRAASEPDFAQLFRPR
ncbi:MAG: RluA family pseudouridine synthase [Planctomycetota bacterium]|nr:RluA family pseudouridine synthase [Planctomycetota bacterium]